MAGLVGAATGAAAVMLDDSGAVLVVPFINSSVTPLNMETPPMGDFPFGLYTSHSKYDYMNYFMNIQSMFLKIRLSLQFYMHFSYTFVGWTVS